VSASDIDDAAANLSIGTVNGVAGNVGNVVTVILSYINKDGNAATVDVDLTVAADGSYSIATLDADALPAGVDATGSFSYQVKDDDGLLTADETATITITGINDDPLAVNDIPAVVDEGATAIFDLAVNDYDLDNPLDLSTISIVNFPVNGMLNVHTNGTVTYIHDGTESVSDSFTYTINDLSGFISNFATVTITVNPVNDAPTTTGITDVSVAEDSAPTSIDLNAAFNDTDNPDSELTYSIENNTGIGLYSSTAVNAVTGELELIYAADMNGSSQISVRATDLDGEFVETLFTVIVTPVNDVPVIVENTGVTVLGATQTVISGAELSINDVDDVNAGIVYTITAVPENGFLTLNGVIVGLNTSFTEADILNNNLSYQFNGSGSNDRFEFTITDSNGGSVSGNSFNIVVMITPPEPETVVITAPAPDVSPYTPKTGGGSGISSNLSAESIAEVKEIEDWYAGGTTTANNSVQPQLSLDPDQRVEQEPTRDELKTIEESLVDDKKAEINFSKSSGVADIQRKAIKALWTSIDQIKQQIDENVSENISDVEFRAAAVSSSGVALTAGVVAWVLRGGALMTSLISTIPLWKGYDPLPILAYKDEEDEKIVEEKVPTSLEEMKKARELKDRMKKYNQVDGMFDGMET